METAIQMVREQKEVLDAGLARLKQEILGLAVKDNETYLMACNIKLAGQKYIKNVDSKLDPGIDSAKDHLNTLKNQKASYVVPAQEIVNMANSKGAEYKRLEREAAEREQRRIQLEREQEARAKAEAERREADRIAKEQRLQRERELEELRKAGEIGKREETRLAKQAAADAAARELSKKQAAETAANVEPVRVESSVPKVAGIRQRLNWKFRIVDANKIPNLFLIPDEVSIGQHVRLLKDKARAESSIPGIEVWSEDGI
jgi:hypothetical protein